MLTTLSVISLDQGKIYRASPASQFDDRTVAETHVNQRGPSWAEDRSRGPQAPSRLTPGFAHVLRWMLAMLAPRGKRPAVQKDQKDQKTTAGRNIAPA
jgi:hypothetical protein